MFGEELSESPRQPSPWRALSSSQSNSPSPLSLRTPLSTPGTPQSSRSAARSGSGSAPGRQPSLDSLLSAGLSEFESLSLDGCTNPANRNDMGRGLSPEVDHQGHIEYKFKLPKPTPLRLAKLVTQMKWRLIEGGGTAFYELGVLDNGTLVGLNHAEMTESLETLGKMLSALGGGEIRVARVVKFGGSGFEEETSDSGGDSTGGSSQDRQSRSSTVFQSFEVEATEMIGQISSPLDDIYNLSSSTANTASKDPCANPTPPPTPPTAPVIYTAPTLTAHVQNPANHDRTPEERAILKRMKRDARRSRPPLSSDLTGAPSSDFGSVKIRRVSLSHHENQHQNHHRHSCHVPHEVQPVKIRGVSSNKPKSRPNSLKHLSKSAPALVTLETTQKPTLPQENGEIRYVVEAVVTKRSSSGARRNVRQRASSTSLGDIHRLEDEEDVLDGQMLDDEDENEEEGWKYLNFDSLH